MTDEPEFQLGLVMAGAISAGAYTAGVMDFMIEALDSPIGRDMVTVLFATGLFTLFFWIFPAPIVNAAAAAAATLF